MKQLCNKELFVLLKCTYMQGVLAGKMALSIMNNFMINAAVASYTLILGLKKEIQLSWSKPECGFDYWKCMGDLYS